MQSAEEILAGLTRIATESLGFAVAWHVAIAFAVIALLRGKTLPALAVVAPLASASAFAWAYGNPFNGVLLGATAFAFLALRDRGHRRLPALVYPGLGSALILFAWVYPHFVDSRSPFVYLYASPVGLVPCPSLALAIGFALLSRQRRADPVLALVAFFYGVFGVGVLGVWLDVPLLVGALGLLVRARRTSPHAALSFR